MSHRKLGAGECCAEFQLSNRFWSLLRFQRKEPFDKLISGERCSPRLSLSGNENWWGEFTSGLLCPGSLKFGGSCDLFPKIHGNGFFRFSSFEGSVSFVVPVPKILTVFSVCSCVCRGVQRLVASTNVFTPVRCQRRLRSSCSVRVGERRLRSFPWCTCWWTSFACIS